jgi:dCTP deaminase
MILCDHDIEKAIAVGALKVLPQPDPSQYDSSSLNLTVGDDFRTWNPELFKASGFSRQVDLDAFHPPDYAGFMIPVGPDASGLVTIAPHQFVLVRTLEMVELPETGRLAARVEGRSKYARLGLSVHITAPTIHAGFTGKITLEMINHGPFHLKIRPNKSRLCQLILEMVSNVPSRGGSATFSHQATPLGTTPQT